MNYETADAKKIDISKLTDPASLEQLRRSYNLRIQNNDAKYQEAVKLWNKMLESAIMIYGRNSAPHKYLYSRKVPKPPNISAEYDKVLKKLKTYNAKVAKQAEKDRMIAAARAKNKDYRERSRKAKNVLIEQGYELYEDFRPTSAISFKKKVLVELPTGTLVKKAYPEPIQLNEEE